MVHDMGQMGGEFLSGGGDGDAGPAATTATMDDAQQQQEQQEAPPPAPLESSFEDLFGIDSYMNGTGDDELGGDFDEDWFKADGI